MSTKITVVHHSADFDGIFCREIARKFLPEAELIGWDFADKPLAIPDGQIYILDLPVDRVFGMDFSKMELGKEINPPTPERIKFAQLSGRDVVWIDHHKSSIESHPANIPGYRIDGVAACRLAWQWFMYAALPDHDGHDLQSKQDFIDRNVIEPLSVRLAGEYDIWDKRDPDAEVFQFGLRSQDFESEEWRMILDGQEAFTRGLIRSGHLLQRYQQRNDAGMMHRSFLVDFEGLKFLALTTARCNSLTFASKDVPETGHDALMGLFFNGKAWQVSLYHSQHRTDLDLSKIAIKHGGGGHKGACGFVSERFPLEK